MATVSILPPGSPDDVAELATEIFCSEYGRTYPDAWALALEQQAELLAFAHEWDQDAAAQRERPDITLGSRWVVYHQNDAQPYEARVLEIDHTNREALVTGDGNGFYGWVRFDRLTEPSPYADVQWPTVPVKHVHRWIAQGVGLPSLCTCGKTKRIAQKGQPR